MDKDEALKMAIEAMKWLRMRSPIIYEELEAEKACKEALAQPAQEPVAWMTVDYDAGFKEIKVWQEPISNRSIPLYTHPAPSWQGLTSEEIRSLDLDNDVISVIFQTEKLLKEKNAKV